jgi:TIR domain
MKYAAGFVVFSILVATIYGVIFSGIYPLVDIDESLISLFILLGLVTSLTCVGIFRLARRNTTSLEISKAQRALEASEKSEAMQLAEERRTSSLAKVFISYRREDSKWPARQLYEAFLRHLPHEQVFIDIDSIPPGADFVEILQHQVRECEIVLALIGPGWVENTDAKTGQRRLDDPKDFVRIEICAALSRAIPVVPVLLEGAQMPKADQLPEDMRMLVRRQAEFVGYLSFDTDVDRLIRRLGFGKEKQPSPGPSTPPGSGGKGADRIGCAKMG